MLAEAGACCLHFSRKEKQVKGLERTARCDLARRTNQVNFQSHDTERGKKNPTSLLRSFTGNYFVVIAPTFHSQIMIYVASITNREKKIQEM